MDHVSWLLSLESLRAVSYRFSFRDRMLWLCHCIEGKDVEIRNIPRDLSWKAGYKDHNTFEVCLPGGTSHGRNPDIFSRIDKGVYRWFEAFKEEAHVRVLVPDPQDALNPDTPSAPSVNPVLVETFPERTFEAFYADLEMDEREALESLVTQQVRVNGSDRFRLKSKHFSLSEAGLVLFMEKLRKFHVVQIIGPNEHGLQKCVWELDQARFQCLLDLHRLSVTHPVPAVEEFVVSEPSVSLSESVSSEPAISGSREIEIMSRLEEIDRRMTELERIDHELIEQRTDIAKEIGKKAKKQNPLYERIKRLKTALEEAQGILFETQLEIATCETTDASLSVQMESHKAHVSALLLERECLEAERHNIDLQRRMLLAMPWLQEASNDSGLELSQLLQEALKYLQNKENS